MGPPSLNGGNAPPSDSTPAPHCFNGAAVSQRRKPSWDWAGPLSVSGFNGAAVSQRRKRAGVRFWGRRGRACFNGAAVSQRRKLPSLSCLLPPHRSASMGPPSLNGGNVREVIQVVEDAGASMGPPSLNGGNKTFRSASVGSRPSFNGAAVSQRRKRQRRVQEGDG